MSTLKLKGYKVDVVVRSYHHPTSSTFIRLISPLSYGSLGGELSIKLVDGERWKLRRSVRAVIIQRTAIPSLDSAKQLVGEAKRRGILVFVDTDDNFNHLDKDHPQYIEQAERTRALDFIINNADEVWFSTDRIQEEYGVKNSKVVQNTLDSRVWSNLSDAKPDILLPRKDEPLQVLYMGTTTHSNDFNMVVPVLEKLYGAYPGQFELSVIGVAQSLQDTSWMKVLSPESALYPDFISWLEKQGPFDIGISPLEDTPFNRGKSDIKCLDYLGLGIEPIVSDIEAYSNPEISDYITRVINTEDEWFKALEDKLVNRNRYRRLSQKRATMGVKYIDKYRSVAMANRQIHESLEKHLR